MENHFTYCYIRANVCTGDSVVGGSSVNIVRGIAEVSSTYISNTQLGIYAQNARVFSNNNDDTGTLPAYGITAGSAGTIGKAGTQPAGSTANELTSIGGEIRA